MPIPVFSAGEVLTAANMNAVGLWRVTGCTVSSVGGTAATASNGVITVGTNNTSVTVTNAFSADFDNYFITVSGGTASGNTTLSFRCGTQATGYRYSYLYTSYTSSPQAVGVVPDTKIEYVGFVNTSGTNALINVSSPFLSGPTMVVADGGSIGNFAGRVTGLEPNNTSFTSFTLFPTTGSFSASKIRVYGYRN